jgi:hypothetical protein
MAMPTEQQVMVARRFVNLVFNYERWDQVEELPHEHLQVFYEIVREAGFKHAKLKPGKLMGCYRDGRYCPSVGGPINHLSPYKVVGKEGDDPFATGWLTCALTRVASGRVLNQPAQKLIVVLADEIERSVPFEPITLTLRGDVLVERPPWPSGIGSEFFVKRIQEQDSLTSHLGAGLHEKCGGVIDFRNIEGLYALLLCSHERCRLRVVCPKGVTTYRDLREGMAAKLDMKQYRRRFRK